MTAFPDSQLHSYQDIPLISIILIFSPYKLKQSRTNKISDACYHLSTGNHQPMTKRINNPQININGKFQKQPSRLVRKVFQVNFTRENKNHKPQEANMSRLAHLESCETGIHCWHLPMGDLM